MLPLCSQNTNGSRLKSHGLFGEQLVNEVVSEISLKISFPAAVDLRQTYLLVYARIQWREFNLGGGNVEIKRHDRIWQRNLHHDATSVVIKTSLNRL